MRASNFRGQQIFDLTKRSENDDSTLTTVSYLVRIELLFYSTHETFSARIEITWKSCQLSELFLFEIVQCSLYSTLPKVQFTIFIVLNFIPFNKLMKIKTKQLHNHHLVSIPNETPNNISCMFTVTLLLFNHPFY